MRSTILAIGAAAFFAMPATAQVFPDPTSTSVNDSANMIDAETEARLVDALEDLERRSGTEMTIATLSSVQFYANDTEVADYTTQLFNYWGVGDPDEGDGILMLIFLDDNELRLELGTGYGDSYTAEARDVVNDVILPAFRDGDFSKGIEAGTTATIDTIALPFKGMGTAAPAPSGKGGNALWYILGGIGAAIAGLVGLNRRRAATPCPSCGNTGLTKAYTVLTEATLEAEGSAETRTTCPHCGWSEAEPRTLSKLKPDEKPEFSGGKADGKGATGKW